MSLDDLERRGAGRAPQRGVRPSPVRMAAVSSIAVVVLAVTGIAVAELGGGSSHRHVSAPPSRHHGTSTGKASSASTTASATTGSPGTAPVPILAYQVIAPTPPGAASPDLYVPPDEFAAQMQALKAAGWHAVTMNQLEAYWTRGLSLGPGKPIVLTFDTGYRSQYTNALPVLKQLGWVGTENLRVNGLPPGEGGLTDSEIRGLLAAGWELDTAGLSNTDLITLDTTQVQSQVMSARAILRQRYGVPVNWLTYPSGHYNAAVTPAVQAAGFLGATTVVPGWAAPTADRYRLPRLQVLPGTSGSSLLAQIASSQGDAPPPEAYGG
jgi:peptidoglycan/xylan/chitin deacetylase (PgdA/CDA1 family)